MKNKFEILLRIFVVLFLMGDAFIIGVLFAINSLQSSIPPWHYVHAIKGILIY